MIAIIPIQNAAAGGPWWELPYGRYTRAYLPFDHMGLGLDEQAPTRSRPPDIEKLANTYAIFHRNYTVAQVPGALVARIQVFFSDLAGDWALLAFMLAAIGVAAGPAPLRFAAPTVGILFVAHLGYAHPPEWSLYYADALPAAAAAVAAGAALLGRLGNGSLPFMRHCDAPSSLLAAAALALAPLPERLEQTRLNLAVAREPIDRFRRSPLPLTPPR